MTQDIARLTQLARADQRLKFNSLMGMVFRPEGLRDSFERLAGNKAPGVDGVRKDEGPARAGPLRLSRLRATVKGPSWEPYGGKLQVRF